MIPFIIGFISGTLIILAVYSVESAKYKKTTYYKDKKVSLIRILTNKGANGEYQTYKMLMKYEKQGAKFLFNCYLPAQKDKTSEVDVIMIYKSGIYVLESKNYSGWIFGNESDKKWTQTLNAGKRVHKEHFYNPIMQNQTHIKWLRELLKSEISFDITPFSLIVFSERCKLKNITNTNPLVKVINRYDILKEISVYDNMVGTVVSDEMVDKIYSLLKPYTEVDDATKQKHIDNINDRYKESDNSVLSEKQTTVTNEDEVCPRCGAKLVLRTAQKGENAGKQFYGCSSYPKCRYIKNI